jgi:hypothetical protein
MQMSQHFLRCSPNRFHEAAEKAAISVVPMVFDDLVTFEGLPLESGDVNDVNDVAGVINVNPRVARASSSGCGTMTSTKSQVAAMFRSHPN